jgi:hypothetical protein
MVVGKGTDLSKRALSYIHCLMKHHQLVQCMFEDRELVLESFHSLVDNEEYLPAAFLLQLCFEATSSELI